MENSVGISQVLEPQEMNTNVLNQKRVFPFLDSSSSGSSASSKGSWGSSASSKGSLSATSTKILYMFYKHYSFSKYSHSLYKIEIEIDMKIPTTRAPCLVLDFPTDKYPRGMSCVRLGSKLYFLGGRRDFIGGRRVKNYEQVFPRDVYVFDTSINDFRKIDACLNAGKHECIVFAANGKLYTLDRIPDLPISKLLSLSLFECFDPVTNKWRVLDNLPPLKNKSVTWMGCTVFGKRQQVVLVGVEGATKLVKFIFHVHQEKWTRHALHDVRGSETFSFSETLSFQEGGHDVCLYGLLNRGPPVKSRSGVMGEFSGNDPVDGLIHMSIPGTPTMEGRKWAKWVKSFFGHLSGEETSRSLRYLGKDYFIYIASGSPCGDSDGYLSPDFYTQEISLTLFKEEQKNQEGDEKLHFEADILHSKKYEFQNQDSTMKLVASFVIAPEQLQKKLDMMEDKKKKKNKKYMKNKKKKKNDNLQSFGDTNGCW